MGSLQESIQEYKIQLQKGIIQKAYRGLMEYMLALKRHLLRSHPDHFTSGSLYFGYMDMTYFSLTPESIKDRKLKIGIVFHHQACRFEVWLFGINKQVQADYWKKIKESGWKQYHLVPSIKSFDAIIDHILVEEPDFSNLDALTSQIEQGTMKFSKDVERFLISQKNLS